MATSLHNASDDVEGDFLEVIIKEEEISLNSEDNENEFENKDPLTATTSETGDLDDEDIFRKSQENNTLKNSFVSTNIFKSEVLLPGAAYKSKDATTMANILQCFITTDIVDIIVEYTNQKAIKEIQLTKASLKRERNWTPTDRNEIYAFFGLSLIIGALKVNRRESIHYLWSNDPCLRRSIFQGTLSKSRFQQLSSYLRFEDAETIKSEIRNDMLAPIRQIFVMFVDNCKINYNSNSHLTFDEQLLPFRGECPFRVYKFAKSGRYGIKLRVLVDAVNGYCKNLQVHLDKTQNKDYYQDDILNITKCLGRGYCIINNSWISVSLANNLFTRGLTTIGTVKKEKNKDSEIPAHNFPQLQDIQLATSSLHQEGSADLLVIAHAPTAEILLSTEKTCDGGEDIVTTFNSNKNNVEHFTQLATEYSSNRPTEMWPKRLMMHLIDIAAINSFIIWSEKNPGWPSTQPDKRRHFLFELGKQLVQVHVSTRLHTQVGFQKSAVIAMRHILGEDEEYNKRPAPDLVNVNNKRLKGRCHFCSRKKDRKTTTVCHSCGFLVCKEHSTAQILCCKCRNNDV